MQPGREREREKEGGREREGWRRGRNYWRWIVSRTRIGNVSDNTRCGLYFSSYFFSLFLLPPLPSFPSFFSFFFIPTFFLIIFVISPSWLVSLWIFFFKIEQEIVFEIRILKYSWKNMYIYIFYYSYVFFAILFSRKRKKNYTRTPTKEFNIINFEIFIHLANDSLIMLHYR